MLYLWLVALAFAGARFFIPTHAPSPAGSYEAFAHLFVGGLIGAALASKKWGYFWIAAALTGVEVVAFFTH